MFYKHTQDTETSQQFSTVDKQAKCTCSSYFSQTKAWKTKRSLSPWLISCFTVESVLRDIKQGNVKKNPDHSSFFCFLLTTTGHGSEVCLLVSQSQPPTTSSYSRTLNTVFLPVLFGIGAQCDTFTQGDGGGMTYSTVTQTSVHQTVLLRLTSIW